jgi:hypothetical protein
MEPIRVRSTDHANGQASIAFTPPSSPGGGRTPRNRHASVADTCGKLVVYRLRIAASATVDPKIDVSAVSNAT